MLTNADLAGLVVEQLSRGKYMESTTAYLPETTAPEIARAKAEAWALAVSFMFGEPNEVDVDTVRRMLFELAATAADKALIGVPSGV